MMCCSLLLLVTVLSHSHTHPFAHSLCLFAQSQSCLRELSLCRASVFSFSCEALDFVKCSRSARKEINLGSGDEGRNT